MVFRLEIWFFNLEGQVIYIAIPKTYTEPDSKSNYTKLTPGTHRLRVLGDAITGWVWWLDTPDGGRKPVRVMENESVPVDTGKDARKFIAFPVLNYTTGNIQVWEVTQKSIKSDLLRYEKDEDWGDLTGYDIVVERKGQTLQDTKYTTSPKPKQVLNEATARDIVDFGLPELRALYFGEDPFTYVLTDEQVKELEERAKSKKEDVEVDEKDLPF